MKWKFVEVPLPPVGEGWGEQVYLDDTLRIQVLESVGASELAGCRGDDKDKEFSSWGFLGVQDSPQPLWPSGSVQLLAGPAEIPAPAPHAVWSGQLDSALPLVPRRLTDLADVRQRDSRGDTLIALRV